MQFPKLPAGAAYIYLRNPTKRNALSIGVLEDLRDQLVSHLTSPVSGRLLTLPPFKPTLLPELENATSSQGSLRGSTARSEYQWLVNSKEWTRQRGNLPSVLVLRSAGPVFSSGHDLKELASQSHTEVKRTFALCAELVSLIRHSPAPIICPIQGLATAAGMQLALSVDYPIALSSTKFQLPGATIGLPCTSPSTAVSRRLPLGQTYRLLLSAESMMANDMSDVIDIVPAPEHSESTDTASIAFEGRVAEIVGKLAERAAQPTALGKWAYWTQVGIRGEGGDGYEDAAAWSGRVMALHAKSEDAIEGISAFIQKRKPEWKS
jgi:enoyl-CoA hydratase/carnithine racemase